MKKWSEIKQATLNELFLTEAEARQYGYLEKFQYLANKCLNFIANGVKPKIKQFEFVVIDEDYAEHITDVIDADSAYYDKERDVIVYEKAGVTNEIAANKYIVIMIQRRAYILYKDELVEVITVKHSIPMPEDFINFAGMVNYKDNEPTELVYVGGNRVYVNEPGEYVVFYKALWSDITKNDVDSDNTLDIDVSVLNCLPAYIASQVLMEDDVVRASVLKNDFELMLARLDADIIFEEAHFVSEGGWY